MSKKPIPFTAAKEQAARATAQAIAATGGWAPSKDTRDARPRSAAKTRALAAAVQASVLQAEKDGTLVKNPSGGYVMRWKPQDGK